MALVPVIICGGAGTRLWPVSRVSYPKPFMPLPGGGNLLRRTFERASGLGNVAEILTVTNTELFFQTQDEYLATGLRLPCSYILEPFGRNTAAAVASAALDVIERHDGDAVMLVLPADHLIADAVAFNRAVEVAKGLAAEGALVTFGIRPDYPETGFGYIEAGGLTQGGEGVQVTRFVEKPDYDTAVRYLQAGNFFWNSGMFCFKAGEFVRQMDRYAPDVMESCRDAMASAQRTSGQGIRCTRLDAGRFAQVPDISVDYALMERSDNVVTVPCDIGWSDIGSWSAMSELTAADEHGNRLDGNVIVHASSNNFVMSPDRLTALVGVQDLVVVDTPDAILVAHRDNTQDVKHIVSQLKGRGHETHLLHRTVYRPWGTYTTLEEGKGFKIKRIVVRPGASLSLQMHHHRSEHWIVVSGVACVVKDDQELLLASNQSTFIPAGHKHRLSNPGVLELVLIEVQSGDYLGEDDIVRFEDNYGRNCLDS